MKKKNRQKAGGFDTHFDNGDITIDFSQSQQTEGLSKVIKLAPLTIPSWINVEIEKIAQMQANPKSAVIRQLLLEALTTRQDRLKVT